MSKFNVNDEVVINGGLYDTTQGVVTEVNEEFDTYKVKVGETNLIFTEGQLT